MQAPILNDSATADVTAPRTITFAEINERVAAFHVAEAARNTPAAIAVNAIDTLRAALRDCTADERADVLALLADEILTPVTT
jgi:hypothetical protein